MKKKPEKKLIRFAWVIALMFIGSLVGKACRVPGYDALFLLPAYLFVFFFLPIYFISKRKTLKENHLGYFSPLLQFFALAMVELAIVFNEQQYSGARLMMYFGTGSLLLLILTLATTKHFRIERPIYPALFTLVCFLSIISLENMFVRKKYENEVSPILAAIHRENNELQQLLSKQLNTSDNQLIQLLDDVSYKLYLRSAVINPDDASKDSIQSAFSNTLTGNPNAFFGVGYEKYDAGGSDLLLGSSPAYAKTKYKIELKAPLVQFIDEKKVPIPTVLTDSTLFAFDGVFQAGRSVPWEEANFNMLPTGTVLLKLELLKCFILENALKSAPDSLKIHYYETARKHKSFYAYAGEISEAAENTTDMQKPFKLLLALACLLLLFIFHLPTFPIKERWKRVVLLFIVVIIFEYILLVVDYFVGIYSSGVEIILGVNILLALGLVALDYFLRNNFLEWYKPKTDEQK